MTTTIKIPNQLIITVFSPVNEDFYFSSIETVGDLLEDRQEWADLNEWALNRYLVKGVNKLILSKYVTCIVELNHNELIINYSSRLVNSFRHQVKMDIYEHNNSWDSTCNLYKHVAVGKLITNNLIPNLVRYEISEYGV